MKNRSNKILYRNRACTIILCVLLCLLCCVSIVPTRIAAEDNLENKYTGVIEDLLIDETFNAAEYPKVNTDYSLQIIQIAESKDNELFIYVYQPCGNSKDLRATHVRISTTLNENARWLDYALTYIDNESTLYKYKVTDFAVKSDLVRYYDIPCIFRAWDGNIDPPADNNNTINEVSYEVNQLWTASTSGDNVSYRMEKPGDIVVTDKYVGTLYYAESALAGSWTETAVFYVAFSTDIVMDKLYEADISFAVEFEYYATGNVVTGDNQTVTVTSEQTGSGKSGWYWWSKTHTWNCIESVSDFIKHEDLIAEAKKVVENKAWVIRFHKIENKYNNLTQKPIAGTYRASNTTILRLKFITDGVAYNLGVVDNRQTSSGNIDNIQDDDDFWKQFKDFFVNLGKWFEDYWEWIVVGVLIVIALILLSPFLPSIFRLIGGWIKSLFNGLIWLLGAPIRLIMQLFGSGDDE